MSVLLYASGSTASALPRHVDRRTHAPTGVARMSPGYAAPPTRIVLQLLWLWLWLLLLATPPTVAVPDHLRQASAPNATVAFNLPRKTRHGTAQDLPFAPGMVLQRGPMVSHVWGTCRSTVSADGGRITAKVVVQVLAESGSILGRATASVTANGTWTAELPPLEPAVGATLTASAGGDPVMIHDVAVGDVYL